MVKLDIVPVEILTNIICVPIAYVFRKYMCILSYMLLQQADQEVYALKDVKIHTKTSEPESLFHKVAGLQPAVLLKKRL